MQLVIYNIYYFISQKYEDEKGENDKLRKELENTKKDLLDAKNELDKMMKQKDAVRNADRVCIL